MATAWGSNTVRRKVPGVRSLRTKGGRRRRCAVRPLCGDGVCNEKADEALDPANGGSFGTAGHETVRT